MKKESGIVAIKNLKTDQMFLFYSTDIASEKAKQRFQLDLGMHPCLELQKDYAQTGLELFLFETLELTDNPQRLEELKSLGSIYLYQ